MVRVVLSLPGGGALGAIQAACLARIEERMAAAGIVRESIAERLSLIYSTSVGSINGGVLASGKLNAAGLLAMFRRSLPAIFTRKGFLPKYDSSSLDGPVNGALGAGFLLRQCQVPFAATTINECDEEYHPIESWDRIEGGLPVLTAMKRSSAAPVYFGGIVDEQAQAVWLDGGTGALNCPLLLVLRQCVANGWLFGGDRVHVVNVGCGFRSYGKPFRQARRRWFKNLRELLCFADPDDGGLARKQSTWLQIQLCQTLAEMFPAQFSFENLDVQLTPEQDKLDNTRDTEEFVRMGREMGDRARLELWR